MPHAVSINEMTEDNSCPGVIRIRDAVKFICPGVIRIRDAIKFLLKMELIKQDSRTIRGGHRAADREDMYFTLPEKRDIIDLAVYGMI